MVQKNVDPKLCIAGAFIELVETMPIDKITIGMIADKSGKHRKTFYYHFCDKDQLILWIFRYDLARSLYEVFSEDVLVWEERSIENPFAEFPFYVHNDRGGGLLYHASFFETLAKSLEYRRAYYRKILHSVGSGTLSDYLYSLYRPRLVDDIFFLISNSLEAGEALDRASFHTHIAQSLSIDFLAEFYTGAFVTRLVRRLHDAQARRTLKDVIPFENIIHDSLRLLVSEKSMLYSAGCIGGTHRKAQPDVGDHVD